LADHIEIHVIEHDDIRLCRERLFHFLEGLALNLDLKRVERFRS
jgi:hypothetical protein